MSQNQGWVWVTGASSGIGEAVSRKLLNDGRKVIVSARNASALEDLARDFPDTCQVLTLDLTDPEQLENAGLKLGEFVDSLQAVVVNAGTCEYIDVKKFSAAPFERVMAINFQGAVNTIELALPFLRRSPERAQLVGVASMVTVLPLTRSEAYGASKAALEYLINSLRVDLAREDIDVTLVRPGFVKTPLTDQNNFDMPFIIPADEAAEHIVTGMNKRKLRVQFPWQLVAIMTFIRWLPLGLQQRLLAKMVQKQQGDN